MATNAVVHRAGEGQAFWMLGGLYEVLLSSDETNGATTVMQMTMRKGMGPPPHIHHGVTETVYVVDGTISYEMDGRKVEGGPGSLFRIPARWLFGTVPGCRAPRSGRTSRPAEWFRSPDARQRQAGHRRQARPVFTAAPGRRTRTRGSRFWRSAQANQRFCGRQVQVGCSATLRREPGRHHAGLRSRRA